MPFSLRGPEFKNSWAGALPFSRLRSVRFLLYLLNSHGCAEKFWAKRELLRMLRFELQRTLRMNNGKISNLQELKQLPATLKQFSGIHHGCTSRKQLATLPVHVFVQTILLLSIWVTKVDLFLQTVLPEMMVLTEMHVIL
uniref:Protein lap4 n=1 Tax=Anthurium amnicola TaxID=1678845 RepID=A0A1D1YUJ4_9ARAE